jgi:hypothetical protein
MMVLSVNKTWFDDLISGNNQSAIHSAYCADQRPPMRLPVATTF